MSEAVINILLVEDNPGDVRLIEEMLQAAAPLRYHLEHADCLESALVLLDGSVHTVLLDLGLPDNHKLEGLQAITQRRPDLPVIVLTGLRDEALGFAAVRDGAQDFLVKGEVNPPVLSKAIAYAIERQRLKSELEKAARDLQDSELRQRRIIEENSDGMLIVSLDGTIRFANPAAEKLLGQSAADLLGAPFPQSLGDATTLELDVPGEGGYSRICEVRLVHTEWQGEPVFLASLRDITERRIMEERLRSSHKMEALANLTRGIAHDFNNALAAIIGYAGVLEMRLEHQPDLVKNVRRILAATDRASRLTRALLAFSRDQPTQMQRIELTSLVERVGKLLPPVLGSDIRLRIDVSGEALPVQADSAQIEQTLINLAANARNAMPEGGELVLTLEREELDQIFRRRYGFGQVGVYAHLAMADSGEGMDEETCRRVFDPYFTTCDGGQSAGLGLAIVYGIVKRHGGYITCTSTPGEGTVFDLYLPLATPTGPIDRESKHA